MFLKTYFLTLINEVIIYILFGSFKKQSFIPIL